MKIINLIGFILIQTFIILASIIASVLLRVNLGDVEVSYSSQMLWPYLGLFVVIIFSLIFKKRLPTEELLQHKYITANIFIFISVCLIILYSIDLITKY